MVMKEVEMQMLQETLDKIERLKEVLHTKNRSEIVKTSIDIAALVGDIISHRGNVILEDSNGNRTKLTFPGVS